MHEWYSRSWAATPPSFPLIGCLGKASIYNNGQCPDTTSATDIYQCMWDKFVFFTTHLSTGKQPCLSASPCHIRCFSQALSEEGKAPSTVRGYMSGTAVVHTSAGYNDPTSNYLVSKHLKGLTSEHGSVDDRHPLSRWVLHFPSGLVARHVRTHVLRFLAHQ